MRPCDGCTACCTWLNGSAHGHDFGNGKSCRFLSCSGCSVHRARPRACENYFCAWAQELLPEDMRPDKCNIIASVESNENGQFLKLSLINNTINNNALEYFKKWGELMNTPVLYSKNGSWELL